MAMIVRRTAKLNQCDNIVSTSSFGLPAALMALSDTHLNSQYISRDLTFEQGGAQRNWTAATPVCCQIVRVERLAGLQPVASRSSRHTSHRGGCKGDDARGWPHRMRDQSRYPDRGGCDRQPAHRGAATPLSPPQFQRSPIDDAFRHRHPCLDKDVSSFQSDFAPSIATTSRCALTVLLASIPSLRNLCFPASPC